MGGIVQLIRYRFLLFAGLLPYCLGASIAYNDTRRFDAGLFSLGFTGLFFVLAGVEAFNEYFDWQYGTDRVFQLDPKPVTRKTFYAGAVSFAIALLFAIYLTAKAGLGIILFALAGFLAAAGYLGPPLRFTYRGLGEIIIALSYGPFMVAGSYYLQTGTVTTQPLLISIIPAILLFQIALANEVPDFIQDKLVGKKNLCVRMGRKKTVKLYRGLSAALFILCGSTACLSNHWIALTLLLMPLAYRNGKSARANHETPVLFLPVIRGTIILYVIIMVILILGFPIVNLLEYR